jgi:hypothetical protein
MVFHLLSLWIQRIALLFAATYLRSHISNKDFLLRVSRIGIVFAFLEERRYVVKTVLNALSLVHHSEELANQSK